MNVLFLTQTSGVGASARYRVYQFLGYLEKQGIHCTVSPAVTDILLEQYQNSNKIFTKSCFYLSQFLKRLSQLPKTRNFDIVFLQRDLVIHLYPFIEKLMFFFNNNIIFDFDDVIYLYPPSKKPNLLFNLLWDKKKIKRIIKISKHVVVANNFLKSYALKFTKNVTVIPTSINLSLYNSFKQQKINTHKTVIGWIGSQITFSYLQNIFPVFLELAKRYEIELKVIGARGPLLDGLNINYKDWDLSTEIEDIYSFDIGVMPLTNDEWSEGKSGTKLLQYMAAGVPAVASPVGVNEEIIRDGVNGFLVDSHDEWIRKISYLIDNKFLVERMIQNARITVEENYSIKVNAPKLLKVFEEVLKQS